MKIRDKVLIVEDEQNIKNFMSTILAGALPTSSTA